MVIETPSMQSVVVPQHWRQHQNWMPCKHAWWWLLGGWLGCLERPQGSGQLQLLRTDQQGSGWPHMALDALPIRQM